MCCHKLVQGEGPQLPLNTLIQRATLIHEKEEENISM